MSVVMLAQFSKIHFFHAFKMYFPPIISHKKIRKRFSLGGGGETLFPSVILNYSNLGQIPISRSCISDSYVSDIVQFAVLLV